MTVKQKSCLYRKSFAYQSSFPKKYDFINYKIQVQNVLEKKIFNQINYFKIKKTDYMKQLTFLSKFFVLFLAISFWSSCGDDGTGGTGFTLPPTIELQSGTNLVTSATTVNPNAVFEVRVLAEKGDNNMTTFTILEDGIALDASRINYVGVGQLANPYTLTTGEQTTFDTNIEITAHDSGTRTYTFRIVDSAGETDETTIDISTVSTPLSIGLEGANGGITADVTLSSQGAFKVELLAAKGGSPLSKLTVWEDATEVDVARLRFGTDNDITLASNFPTNPLDLINDEKDGFNYFVWVDSHDAGARTYTFQIEDETGETAEVSLVITVQSLVELTAKLLKNADGPSGQGGIDLLTGNGDINSTDAASHLRDQGIDLAQPVDQNWKRKIAPVNGSILRTPGVDFPVSDFNAVTTAAEILQAYDNGDDVIAETAEVVIGDRFLVRTATGETILVLVTDIVQTAMDNADYYELSIKY